MLKHVLLAGIVCVSALGAYAKGGIEGGLNVSTTIGLDGAGSDGFKTGLRFGAFLEPSLSKSVSLQTGLYFTRLGFRANQSSLSYTHIAEVVQVDYLQLPLTFVYSPRLAGTAGRLTFGMGPYVSIAVGGKNKTKVAGARNTLLKYSFGNEPGDQFHRLDIGVDVLKAGYVFDFGLFVRAGWQMSVRNIIPQTSRFSETMHNGTLMFTVGYVFGGR